MDTTTAFNSRLPIPTLIVPGGSAHQDGLPKLWHYLTDGGANHYGGSWSTADRDSFVHGSASDNVFNIHYSETFDTYAKNAQEVQAAIDDIRQRTGAPEVNVVAECKGAEEVRELLSQGGHGIRNLVLMTPMNHGLPL
jgi:triacylglycerol esterase/lipase EstA (alpha/beta hydrolase family)